jgi:parallel beta-helix repeat protein
MKVTYQYMHHPWPLGKPHTLYNSHGREKSMRKRSQQAIEFLTIMGIVIILVTLFIAFLINQSADIQQQSSVKLLEITAATLDQEVENLMTSPSNIYRDIVIRDFYGDMSIRNGSQIVFYSGQNPHVTFLDYYINGQPCKGKNRIFRHGNILGICCGCQEINITFPDIAMCREEPFKWRSCDTLFNETAVSSVIGQCTNETTWARFNITNSTDLLYTKNTTDEVAGWFFIEDLNLSQSYWQFSWECYGAGGLININYYTAPYVPITHCKEIGTAGRYRLTQNIQHNNSGDCLIINHDDVILDGHGHTLIGNQSNYGISASGLDDIVVKDFSLISGYLAGISFNTITNGSITGNTIEPEYRWNGHGTADSPFEIGTCNQLQLMNEMPNAHYILINDINCSKSAGWTHGFQPIGYCTTSCASGGQANDAFSGTFDGNNFTIYDIHLKDSDVDIVGSGVFGKTTPTALLKNVRVIRLSSDLDSDYPFSGGLVAYNQGTITESFISGTLYASDYDYVGGITGYNDGTINASFAIVNITANDYVGGLVGLNANTLTDTYTAGTVRGNAKVGGLVGQHLLGTINHSYSRATVIGTDMVGGLTGSNHEQGGDISFVFSAADVSGTTNVGAVVGKLEHSGTVFEAYWINQSDDANHCISNVPGHACEAEIYPETHFHGSTNLPASIWDFSAVWSNQTNRLPSFQWLGFLPIIDCSELQKMKYNLTANYQLLTDIDCSMTRGWNLGEGFDPVGDSIESFAGNFDGNNHIIHDLYINRSGEANIGLFGEVAADIAHTIQNARLYDVTTEGRNAVGGFIGGAGSSGGNAIILNNLYAQGTIIGEDTIGGLVGEGYGTLIINNSHVAMTLTGNDRVGGIVGFGGPDIIENSRFTGTILGNTFVGGVSADGYEMRLKNTYIAGNITASGDFVGGLLARGQEATIAQSGFSGNIQGNEKVGGLVGEGAPLGAASPTISKSSATGNVTGNLHTGGIIGYVADGTITNAYFSGNVSGGANAGSIAGWSFSLYVKDTYAAGNTSGSSHVGGLIGYSLGGNRLENTYSDLFFSGGAVAGGLIGSGAADTILDSYWINRTDDANTCIGGGADACDLNAITDTNYYRGDVYPDAQPINEWDFATIWQENNQSPTLQPTTNTMAYTVLPHIPSGIILNNSLNVFVSKNSITGNIYGIYITNSQNNNITSNIFCTDELGFACATQHANNEGSNTFATSSCSWVNTSKGTC